jgi:hypothetical protein
VWLDRDIELNGNLTPAPTRRGIDTLVQMTRHRELAAGVHNLWGVHHPEFGGNSAGRPAAPESGAARTPGSPVGDNRPLGE